MNGNQCWLVRMDFERVQTYLFAVPELKSMVGANTRMGEVLRGRLIQQDGQDKRRFVKQVQAGQSEPVAEGTPPEETDNLPALAVACGAQLPGDVKPDTLGLPHAVSIGQNDWDDPVSAYDQGVLARDGGHLNAVFPGKDQAVEFVKRAQEMVGEKLPGLPIACRVYRLHRNGGRWDYACKGLSGGQGRQWPTPEDLPEHGRPNHALPLDLPQFQVCEVAGLGPASEEGRTPEGTSERFSESVKERRDAAGRFAEGKSYDLLGLLRDCMLDRLKVPEGDRRRVEFPTEFRRLARSGYMAAIVADGNNMGGQAEEIRRRCEAEGEDLLQTEAALEVFFHRNRCAVREAVLLAVADTFKCSVRQEFQRSNGKIWLPFRFLMLGGDDLVLVCDAAFGPAFLISYTRALQAANIGLTIGAGMAIVKYAFPFHRAHELAEQLQSSAKRLYRERKAASQATGSESGQAKPPGSTVDWLAVTEAWHDELRDVRREQYVIRYEGRRRDPPTTLVLTGKPYFILDSDAGSALSLERLVRLARDVLAGGPARTQLKGLAEPLPRGRWQAEWAFKAVRDDRLKRVLKELHGRESPWRCVGSNGHQYLSHLFDLMELYELARRRRDLEEEPKP